MTKREIVQDLRDDNLLDTLDNLTQSSSNAPAPASAAPPHPSANLLPGETIADQIAQACGLADVLGQSVCLHCANRVLAMDSKKYATLFCRPMFRDIQVTIKSCTAYQLEAASTQ